MDGLMLDERASPRERVMLFLAFLASDACRAACHRFVPPERLAYELCRLWFDEVYLPGTRYLEGLKAGVPAGAVRRFKTYFTDDELAALERFHRFFELRLDMLPESAHARQCFPQNDTWLNIVRDAGHVLDLLAPDAERLRRRLAWLVASFTSGRGTLPPGGYESASDTSSD